MPDRLRTPCCNWHSRIALDESSTVAAALLVPHVPSRRPPQHINVRLSGRIRKTTDTVSVRHLSPRECLRTPAHDFFGHKASPTRLPRSYSLWLLSSNDGASWGSLVIALPHAFHLLLSPSVPVQLPKQQFCSRRSLIKSAAPSPFVLF